MNLSGFEHLTMQGRSLDVGSIAHYSEAGTRASYLRVRNAGSYYLVSWKASIVVKASLSNSIGKCTFSIGEINNPRLH